jgi:hypothetical protein
MLLYHAEFAKMADSLFFQKEKLKPTHYLSERFKGFNPHPTMQSTLSRALAAFPDSSPNLRAHGFVNMYHSPGLRGQFKTVRENNTITATRERDGFRLEIDLEAAFTSNETSRLPETQYPYDIDNVSTFFIPAHAITCKVRVSDTDMEDLACEGFVCFDTNTMKIDCLDLDRHYYFWYAIGTNCMAFI